MPDAFRSLLRPLLLTAGVVVGLFPACSSPNTAPAEEPPTMERRFVMANALRFRAVPNPEAEAVGKLAINTAVDVLGTEAAFSKVKVIGGELAGQQGYVASDYLEPTQVTLESALKAADQASAPADVVKWLERAAAMNPKDKAVWRRLSAAKREVAGDGKSATSATSATSAPAAPAPEPEPPLPFLEGPPLERLTVVYDPMGQQTADGRHRLLRIKGMKRCGEEPRCALMYSGPADDLTEVPTACKSTGTRSLGKDLESALRHRLEREVVDPLTKQFEATFKQEPVEIVVLEAATLDVDADGISERVINVRLVGPEDPFAPLCGTLVIVDEGKIQLLDPNACQGTRSDTFARAFKLKNTEGVLFHLLSMTMGAGGGSLVHFHNGKATPVGPQDCAGNG